MAAAAGMSRSHFTRLFKAATGESPRAFVVGRRIEKAKELLEADPELPLAELAAEVGFCDQSHLTSHFRKLAGRTPAAFRNEVRHKSPSA